MKMKLSIYVFLLVLTSPLPLLAVGNLDKDIQDSLTSVGSTMSFAIERQEKVNAETERLIKKYGLVLAGPMKTLVLADERDNVKRQLGLAVLVKLGVCDSVKKTFLDILINGDFRVRSDALLSLTKIDKDFAREVAVNGVNTTTDPDVKTSIIPLLGVIGDSNTLMVLKNIEKSDNENAGVKRVARQAREYLEYRLSLPKEQQKSWEDQAYIYWSVFKEEEYQPYIIDTGKYYSAALRMTHGEHKFSLDFLKYHLNQKDPLAVAIISVQKDKSFVEGLKAFLNEDGNDLRLFKNMCRDAIKSLEQQEPNGPREPNAI
jgi:hypothetical protein